MFIKQELLTYINKWPFPHFREVVSKENWTTTIWLSELIVKYCSYSPNPFCPLMGKTNGPRTFELKKAFPKSPPPSFSGENHLKGQYRHDRQGMESKCFRLTQWLKIIPHMTRSYYRCCCINGPVIISHCVHLKLGHRFHALLKVCSDRDDTVPLQI